ncbi:MAG: InlB B-repeat-containing protein, partial [Acidimicrobiales bacterium]
MTTVTAGDLLIFQSQIHSQAITVSSVATSGAGATTGWTLAQRYVDTTNGVITEEIWWATVTTAGSTTITATYSGSIASLTPELVVDSYHPNVAAGGWAVVAGGGAAAASSAAINFPSLNSGTAAAELYWGYAESTGTAVVGSTVGYTYHVTSPAGNLVTDNPALGASAANAPTASEPSGSNTTSIAAIFVDNTAAPVTDTVSFNTQGGSVVSSITAPQTSGITLPPTPTLAGNTFNGWFAASSGGSALTSPYTVGSTTTLYAQWTPNTGETVTYNGNGSTGGTVPVDGTSYTTGNTVTVKANTGALVQTGYTFNDWNTQAGGGGTSYAASGSATFTISASTILYAQWTLNGGGGGGGGGGGTPPATLSISAGNVSITVGGTVSPTAAVTSGLVSPDTATVAGET